MIRLAESKIETLVPRRWPDSSRLEKFSCTMQPSRMRLMLFVPCASLAGFCPGHVRSHSPTQKSNCFCCAAAHGFGGVLRLFARTSRQSRNRIVSSDEDS